PRVIGREDLEADLQGLLGEFLGLLLVRPAGEYGAERQQRRGDTRAPRAEALPPGREDLALEAFGLGELAPRLAGLREDVEGLGGRGVGAPDRSMRKLHRPAPDGVGLVEFPQLLQHAGEVR